MLPDIARHLRAGNTAAAADSQNRSIEFALLLTLPASAALIVIPNEVISVLFERGAFTAADVPATARALAFFAAGLPAFVLIKVFSAVFFANEDTATPTGLLQTGLSWAASQVSAARQRTAPGKGISIKRTRFRRRHLG